MAPRRIGQFALLKSRGPVPALVESRMMARSRVSSLPHSYIVTPCGASAFAMVAAAERLALYAALSLGYKLPLPSRKP